MTMVKQKRFKYVFQNYFFTKASDCLPDFNLNVKSSTDHVCFPISRTCFPIDKIKRDNLNASKSPAAEELHH